MDQYTKKLISSPVNFINFFVHISWYYGTYVAKKEEGQNLNANPRLDYQLKSPSCRKVIGTVQPNMFKLYMRYFLTQPHFLLTQLQIYCIFQRLFSKTKNAYTPETSVLIDNFDTSR